MDRIIITNENFRVKTKNQGTISSIDYSYIRMEDGFEFPINEQSFYSKLKEQLLTEHEIIQKLLDTANMDCYEKDERIRRDFAKKLLQEKL